MGRETGKGEEIGKEEIRHERDRRVMDTRCEQMHVRAICQRLSHHLRQCFKKIKFNQPETFKTTTIHLPVE